MMRMPGPGGAVVLVGGRMTRMLGPGGAVVLVGGRMTRMLGLGSRGIGRSLLFRLGWGRVRPFVVSFAWVGLEVVKDIWGEGATSKLPFGMHTSNPQTHEGEVFHLHSRLSKGLCDPCLGHDTIWRPRQGDGGICRQRKYVDK